MPNNIDYVTHTLIIGGGPAGSTLARKLASENIDTILIEKDFSNDKPCGGGVKSIVFQEFDLPEELELKLITQFDLHSPRHKVSVNLAKTPISIVLRKEFDAVSRSLAKKAGAVLIEGKYISLSHEDNYVVTTIKTKDKILTIRANYVVAADGVMSSVRKDVLGSHPEAILTHYCHVPAGEFDKCEFYFGKDFAPKEYAWVFPHGDKLSIGTVLRDGNKAKELFTRFRNSIMHNDSTKIKGFYIPTWKEDDVFYKNRVFFVGDAAGQVLPFTYEGIYYVMKSADILSEAIIQNKPQLYKSIWNKKYKKRFRFFQRLQSIFLSCDYMANKMLRFFQNEALQQRALKYWEGTIEPLNTGQTIYRLIKHVVRN